MRKLLVLFWIVFSSFCAQSQNVGQAFNAGSSDSDSSRLLQDTILIHYRNGSIIGRDTIRIQSDATNWDDIQNVPTDIADGDNVNDGDFQVGNEVPFGIDGTPVLNNIYSNNINNLNFGWVYVNGSGGTSNGYPTDVSDAFGAAAGWVLTIPRDQFAGTKMQTYYAIEESPEEHIRMFIRYSVTSASDWTQWVELPTSYHPGSVRLTEAEVDDFVSNNGFLTLENQALDDVLAVGGSSGRSITLTGTGIYVGNGSGLTDLDAALLGGQPGSYYYSPANQPPSIWSLNGSTANYLNTNVAPTHFYSTRIRIGGGADIPANRVQLEVWDPAGTTLVSDLRDNGVQRWFFPAIGQIAYSVPAGTPGIIFYNSTGTGRSQIRQLASTGGLSFGAVTGSGNPPNQLQLTTAGDLILSGQYNGNGAGLTGVDAAQLGGELPSFYYSPNNPAPTDGNGIISGGTLDVPLGTTVRGFDRPGGVLGRYARNYGVTTGGITIHNESAGGNNSEGYNWTVTLSESTGDVIQATAKYSYGGLGNVVSNSGFRISGNGVDREIDLSGTSPHIRINGTDEVDIPTTLPTENGSVQRFDTQGNVTWGVAPTISRSVKIANTTRTTGTVSADPDLTRSIAVGGTYRFKAMLIYRGPNTATDLKYELERTTAFSVCTFDRSDKTVGAGFGVQGFAYTSEVTATISPDANVVILEGMFVSGGGNTVRIDWSGTNATNSVTMVAGSYLEIEKLD